MKGVPLRRLAAGACIAGLVLATGGVAGCGGDDIPPEPRVAVGSKGFVESDVIAAAYAEALRRVGFEPVVTDMGSTPAALRGLARDDIQLYPEYTGTAWTSIFGADPLALVGTSRASQEQRVRARLDRDPRFHVFATAPGSNNAVAACLPQSGVRSLAELTGRSISVSGSREAFTRPDAVPGVAAAYGFTPVPVYTTPDRRYEPLRDGRALCVTAYETDPEIRELGLTLLRDPKGILASGVDYRLIALASGDWWRSLPEGVQAKVTEAIDNVSRKMTTAWVRQANRRVALGGESADDVVLELVNISVPGRAAAGE